MQQVPAALGKIVGESQEIRLMDLLPDPDQPRLSIDGEEIESLGVEFDNLVNSIKETGLGEPVKYRKEDDKLFIVDGHRRWTAFRKLASEGLEQFSTIPAVEFVGDYKRYQIVSNTLREDLNAMEEARAYEKIKEILKEESEDEKVTHTKIGNIVGKAQNTISEILALNKLPINIQLVASKNSLWSRSVLLHIARTKAEKQQQLFEQYRERIDENKKPKRPYSKGKSKSAKKTVAGLKKYIDNLEQQHFENKEKQDVKESLEKLKSTIQDILNKLGS